MDNQYKGSAYPSGRYHHRGFALDIFQSVLLTHAFERERGKRYSAPPLPAEDEPYHIKSAMAF